MGYSQRYLWPSPCLIDFHRSQGYFVNTAKARSKIKFPEYSTRLLQIQALKKSKSFSCQGTGWLARKWAMQLFAWMHCTERKSWPRQRASQNVHKHASKQMIWYLRAHDQVSNSIQFNFKALRVYQTHRMVTAREAGSTVSTHTIIRPFTIVIFVQNSDFRETFVAIFWSSESVSEIWPSRKEKKALGNKSWFGFSRKFTALRGGFNPTPTHKSDEATLEIYATF